MTAVSKTYTFVPGTPILAAEANQNFNDLVNYINGEVIVRDASKAFTVVPSGPAADPSSANQFTRKQYVDNLNTAVTTTVTNHTTDLTKRPTINNNATGVKIVSQSVFPTTNVNGDGTVNFPAGSFTNCTSVIATNGSLTAGAPGTNIFAVTITGFNATGFTFRAFKVTSTAAFGTYILEPSVSAGCVVNYIAVGT